MSNLLPIKTGLPAATDMLRLWKFCEKFIKTEGIGHEECIDQNDVDAREFLKGVCEIVGYHEFSDTE